MKNYLKHIGKAQQGVSLVEIILAVIAIAFLSLLVASLPTSINLINKNRHASLARDIASKEIENLRKQSFSNLSNGEHAWTDSDLYTLPGGSAVYIIEDCPIAICTSGEKVKEARVKVIWVESNEQKNVELVTLIGEGGVAQ